MKKTLAILLALALVLCMMPSSAFAEGETSYEIELNKTKFTYNGQEQKPEVKVYSITTQDGKKELTTSDYDLKYPDSSKNEGMYTVSAKGKVSGQVLASATYTINKLNINTDVVVSTNGSILDTDFNVDSLKDDAKSKINIKVGETDVKAALDIVYTKVDNTLKVSVSPKKENNNVIGGIEPTFVIKKDLTSGYTVSLATGYSATPTYNGNQYTPKVVVKSGDTIIPEDEYSVSYNNNVNAGSGTVTITGKGKNYVGSFSENLFTIQQKSIASSDMTFDVSSAPDGATPSVSVYDRSRGKYLASTEYAVSRTSNGNITIEGRGNYNGLVSKTYTVSTGTITSVVQNGTQYYNGSAQTPNITVTGKDKNNNTVTLSSSQYTVKYQKDGVTLSNAPKDAGTYTIVVSGASTGTYGGSVNAQYIISPVPLDWAEIVLGSYSVYEQGVYVPKVSVKHIYGNFYFPETDYTVAYTNLKTSYSKPTVTVRVKEGGNLTTSESTKTYLSKEFTLSSRSISNFIVNFTDYRTSKVYDGTTIRPNVTVKDGSLNKTLTQNLDYTVTYKDSAGKVVYGLKDTGTYSVVITGINGYSGTKTLTFTITGTDISGYTVTLKESSVKATGLAQYPSIVSVKKGYYSSLSASDYTVTYQDPYGKTVTSITAPGTYKVVVTGKNGYSGSTSASFRVIGEAQSVYGVKGAYKRYSTSEPFKLTPSATGDGTGFTFTSSNPEVASVDANGYVTFHKMGRAKITATTIGNKKSEPESVSTVFKVYPKKSVITQKPWKTGKKGEFQVRWNKQDNATRYEIRYSRVKTFKSGTYKTKKVGAAVNSYTTQSTKVKGLKSGYTYYVKVRTVKEVYNDYGQKLTYYGNWSNWRSVKVK